jgi:murein DD-endopeptidase MepM/ murein hydrolase activator NlpD
MEPKFTKEEIIFIKKAILFLGSYLFLLLIVMIPGCVRHTDRPTDFSGVVPVQGETTTHTVKPGETLWRISRNYNVPMEKIAGMNGIEDPTKIKTGMVLIIPLKYANEIMPPKKTDFVYPTGPVQLLWPLKGNLIQGFDDNPNDRHDGIDIKADSGTYIKSAAAGKVVYSGDQFQGYGNLLIIEHSDELSTIYAHCKSFLVYEGDEVPAGHIIASVGATGNATTPHLHFEVRLKNTAVDPMLYLPFKK